MFNTNSTDLIEPGFNFNRMAALFAGLYLSESWYEHWASKQGLGSKSPLYCKTRAIVLFDRVITGKIFTDEGIIK